MRFKAHATTYIDDRIVEEGEEFIPKPKTDRRGKPVEVIPAPHWEPLDEEAKAQVARHKVTFTGEVPDVLAGLEAQLADAMRLHPESSKELAAAVSVAVAEALARVLVPKK